VSLSSRLFVSATLALAVVVSVAHRGHANVTPAASSAPGPVTCLQQWRPATEPVALDPQGRPGGAPLPPAPSPAHQPFHVFCDDHYVATVWLARPTTTVEAVRVAREVVARAEWPSVTLGVNPTVGITGIPGWFWATPEPAVTMFPGDGPGFTLDLHVETVRWTFGDGGSASGLGLAFPSASPVTHLWRRTGTYDVTATVVVAGRLRREELDLPLPAGHHTRTLRHDVAQVRSLLHTV
jgi:hypothetical protein